MATKPISTPSKGKRAKNQLLLLVAFGRIRLVNHISWARALNHKIGQGIILVKNRLLVFTTLVRTKSASRAKALFHILRQNSVKPLTVLLVIALLYFMPITFLLNAKSKGIAGIILQIVAGAVLIFDQIASNRRIRKQVNKVTQNTLLFAFLMTVGLLPLAISLINSYTSASDNKWSASVGVIVLVSATFGSFMTSLTLLRRIRWLKNPKPATDGDETKGPKGKVDEFQASDLSLKNVWLLLGTALVVLILLSYALHELSQVKHIWAQMLLITIAAIYAFTFLPLLMICPLYLLAFGGAKVIRYVREQGKLGFWFWIFVFLVWTWGGLLLLSKEMG